jgi:hypothetical protein
MSSAKPAAASRSRQSVFASRGVLQHGWIAIAQLERGEAETLHCNLVVIFEKGKIVSNLSRSMTRAASRSAGANNNATLFSISALSGVVTI